MSLLEYRYGTVWVLKPKMHVPTPQFYLTSMTYYYYFIGEIVTSQLTFITIASYSDIWMLK